MTNGRRDANETAIASAELNDDVSDWLQDVNSQVPTRLDIVEPSWRNARQADAARACVFGLLLGVLAERYPHMIDDLDRVAEHHPSFTTLPTGERLEVLRGLATDPGRAARWVGPLIGVEDAERIRLLLD